MIDSWKDHVSAMNKSGLILDGITGEHVVKVNAIHTNQVDEIDGHFDLIIIGVKSYDTTKAVRSMLPYMHDDTWVVSPQNSINELLIAPIVGAQRTIGCITTISAGMYEPAHITRTGSVSQSLQKEPISFKVGELDGEITPRVETLVEIFSSAGKTVATDDLWAERWSKMVTNCMVNATSAMTGLMSHEIRENEEARIQILNLAIETVRVGRALGHKVVSPMGNFSIKEMEEAVSPKGHREIMSVLTGSKPKLPGRPSMAQDIMKQRATEIDYLNGFVSKKGKDIGIKTPYSDAVTEVIKGIESGEFNIGIKNILKVSEMVEAYK